MAVNERPIIFSAPMVRAILLDRKTQTRRVVKLIYGTHDTAFKATEYGPTFTDDPPNAQAWTFEHKHPKTLVVEPAKECPYGLVGDRLWVRETWKPAWAAIPGCLNGPGIEYKADGAKLGRIEARQFNGAHEHGWRSPIFMPRWASRITLEIEAVRVQRLQDISDSDIKAEGVQIPVSQDRHLLLEIGIKTAPVDYLPKVKMRDLGDPLPKSWTAEELWRAHWASGWDSINGKRAPWASNPWCWCIKFKKVAE